jgi:multicomponent Na+:H+ antiporter subunit E
MEALLTLLALTLTYVAVTGHFGLGNLGVGLILAGLATAMLRPGRRRPRLRRLPAALWSLAVYVVILLVDIVRSGLQVAGIVLSPSLPIRPGIVAIPSGCESELATALSAHAVSITPGELVVEIDEQGVMYTHCLDARAAPRYVAEAQRMRRGLLRRIFD